MKFIDREVQHPNRVKLKKVREETDGIVYDIERAEGVPAVEGTPLNAATFNQLSQNINLTKEDILTVQSKLATKTNINTTTSFNQDLPIGSYILVRVFQPISDLSVGRAIPIYYNDGFSYKINDNPGSNPLNGTWRLRGVSDISGFGWNWIALCERVA